MSAHSSHTERGMTPIRISALNAMQPAQMPNPASSNGKTIITAPISQVSVVQPAT